MGALDVEVEEGATRDRRSKPSMCFEVGEHSRVPGALSSELWTMARQVRRRGKAHTSGRRRMIWSTQIRRLHRGREVAAQVVPGVGTRARSTVKEGLIDRLFAESLDGQTGLASLVARGVSRISAYCERKLGPQERMVQHSNNSVEL